MTGDAKKRHLKQSSLSLLRPRHTMRQIAARSRLVCTFVEVAWPSGLGRWI